MTRESKLALIIGFVLVLVVGVLVSDHFSQANSMDLETAQPADGPIAMPITDLAPREQRGIENAIAPAPAEQTPRLAAEQPLPPPVIISNSHRDEGAQLADSSDANGSIIDRALEEARRRVHETEFPAAAQTSRSEPQPTDEPAREPVRTLPTPTTVAYTVAKGDTLIGIARKMLGNGERWTEIQKLNADELGTDAAIQIGMELDLPGDAKARKPQLFVPTPEVRGDKRSYTVVPGDTLGEISMRLLGTSRRMDEIVELNELGSADEIFVGMVLKIPAK